MLICVLWYIPHLYTQQTVLYIMYTFSHLSSEDFPLIGQICIIEVLHKLSKTSISLKVKLCQDGNESLNLI